MGTIIAILLVVCLPALWVFLTGKVKFFKTIGAVALCYFTGIIFSVINLKGGIYSKSTLETVAYVLVAIALPLILFGFSFKNVKKLAKKTAISFTLVCVTVIVVSVVAFFIVRAINPEIAAYVCAMVIGLYTGGTPNLIAIGGSLGASADLINYANFSDVIIGGIYFLGLVTFVPKIYKKILDKKKSANEEIVEQQTTNENEELLEEYIPHKQSLFSLLKSWSTAKGVILMALLAIGCVGISFGVYFLLGLAIKDINMILILLIGVSILGIAFSFIPKVRETKGSYQLGQYLVLMFSMSLAMALDYNNLSNLITTIIVMCIIMFSCITIHLLLCKVFKIDSSTALITSVAGVYGPPFIQPVAQACGEEEVIVPGVICGVIGLAIGTFLGVGIGSIFLLI